MSSPPISPVIITVFCGEMQYLEKIKIPDNDWLSGIWLIFLLFSVIRLGFEPRTPSLKGMDKILDFNHKRKTVLTKRDLYSFNAKILLYYKHQRGTGLYFTDSLKVTTPYPLFHDWKLSKPLILYFHLYKGFKGKLYPLKYLRNVSFFTIYAASPIMPLYV